MEQYPATIIKNAVERLSDKIEVAAGEIKAFRETLCSITKEMKESSNKMLHTSKWYFAGSIILSAIIAFSALVQAGIIKIK